MRQTLCPQVITDVFFLHERGYYNTMYFALYFGALMVSAQTKESLVDAGELD